MHGSADCCYGHSNIYDRPSMGHNRMVDTSYLRLLPFHYHIMRSLLAVPLTPPAQGVHDEITL